MRPTNRFRLLPEQGARAREGFSSLWEGERKIADNIPGKALEGQFVLGDEGDARYLLLTSYDSPYEEGVEIVLLDEAGRILEKKSLGTPYAQGVVERLTILSSDTLSFDFQGNVVLKISERSRPRR